MPGDKIVKVYARIAQKPRITTVWFFIRTNIVILYVGKYHLKWEIKDQTVILWHIFSEYK